jgi:hypothetical protein
MRRTLPTFLLLLLLAAPALAGSSDEFDIQLGKTPPKAKAVEPAKVGAVERFLSARQAGSVDAKQRGTARALVAAKADDASLFGPKYARLLAYDFHDGSIEPSGKGAFRVRVYLLFADRNGVVVESRSETLTFTARAKGYVCTNMTGTESMAWDRNGLDETADRLGAEAALARAEDVLHSWSARQRGNAAFSVADIRRTGDDRVLVQCLRFTASRGRRGFDAKDSTLVLVKDGEGYRVDAN